MLVVFLMLLFTSSFAFSQETIVIGQVYDKTDHSPIENVNIYFKDTNVGTSTNAEGYFAIRATEKHGKLVVSAVGYHPIEFKIKQGSYASVEVDLSPRNTLLQDLVVLPGANPALDILQNVRTHRARNNVRNDDAIIRHTQEKTNLFLSDFSARTLERELFRNLKDGILATQDSTLLLPLYHSTNDYALCGKQKTLQESDSLDISIISKEDFTILLHDIENDIDFYQSSVMLFGRDFISPLASKGNVFYRYFLTDSTTNQRGKQYQINFKPKNIHNPTFSGTLFIDSASWAVQSISTNIPSRNNLNFVKSVQINQNFSEQPGSPFTLTNENIALLFDYPMPQRKDSTRIFPTVLVERSTVATDLHLTDNVPQKGNEVSDSIVINSLNSISNTPLIKTATYIANTFLTGYAPLGYVDIGNISNIITFNKMEFMRLGLPLRTSERLMKNMNIEGYGAYGFKDKEWKYMGQMQAKLPSKKRHVFGVRYEDNYVRNEVNDFDMMLHENGIGRGNMEFATSLFWAYNSQLPYTRKREMRLSTEHEWTENIESMLNIRAGRLNYGNPIDAMYARPYHDLPNFRYNKLSWTTRFSWNERVIDKYFKRIHIYNNMPVLFVHSEVGNFRIQTSEAYSVYAKLQLILRQKITLGIAGNVDYTLQSGYIFGDVPYPFLQIMHANESWASDHYRFNLMNNFEFAADKYIILQANWNAGGLLFNQIPWVNRWGLREVFGAKIGYGSLRNGHEDILAFPTNMNTFTTPYAEASAGIGNIFNFVCVEFIGRLSYRNVANAQKWGVKFRFELGM